jgi:hypothetical protein
MLNSDDRLYKKNAVGLSTYSKRPIHICYTSKAADYRVIFADW